MDVDAGIDRDDPDRAERLELPDLVREGKALGDHDPAAQLFRRDRLGVLVEQGADRFGIRGRCVGDLPGDALRCACRVGRRLRADHPPGGPHFGLERDREVDFGLVDGDRNAERGEARDDHVGASVHVFRPPARLTREGFDELPGRLEIDLVEQGAARDIHGCFPGAGLKGRQLKWQAERRPGSTSRSGGSCSAHIGAARGQRSRKRHPDGGSRASGMLPLIGSGSRD
jgi:hypothetical protein